MAQRYLALIFGFTFVVSYLMVLVLFSLNKDITAIQDLITAFNIDWIMLTIVGFSLAVEHLKAFLTRKNNKSKVTFYTLLHTLHKTKKHFSYIFQLFTALQRYTGGVVVAGSNPAVPTIN